MTDVEFAVEPGLSVDEFIDVLRRSTLAERRPVDDSAAMAGIVAHADGCITPRAGEFHDSEGLVIYQSINLPIYQCRNY